MIERNYSIQEFLGDTDIYLIDQIMKKRYNQQDKILDAGCGNGRNMYWFLRNGIEIYGIDVSEEPIRFLKKKYPELADNRILVSAIEKTAFSDNYFNHIICSAVLHFAENIFHFEKMIAELLRILKPGGSLFIRMASDIGLEDKVMLLADHIYLLPDTTKRFLLNKQMLKELMSQNQLTFLEPLKTVNVNDIRCMSTLVLQKNI